MNTPSTPDLSRDMRPLGPGGPVVTSLGLGTMTFGAEADEPASWEILDTYREAGGTFLDTADVYSDGASERIVGGWLADRGASEMIVATKGRFAPPPGSTGASRRGITMAIDSSLRRLGVEAIDVYFVHAWDRWAPVEDTLGALTDAVRAGKLHSIGWSNTAAWQFTRILERARAGGYVVPTVFQPQYNLLDRNIEVELLPLLMDEGIATTPWSPLGGGWLTGKYSKDEHPTGSTRLGEDPQRGVEAYDTRNVQQTWDVLDVIEQVAADHEVWVGAVALAWLLTRPTVGSVLLGARTADQLRQNLAAAELELSDEELARITKVSAPGIPPYPYDMIRQFSELDTWDRLGTRHADQDDIPAG